MRGAVARQFKASVDRPVETRKSIMMLENSLVPERSFLPRCPRSLFR